jgi:hypothetical protein
MVSRRDSGFANAPQYYVIRILPVLLLPNHTQSRYDDDLYDTVPHDSE